jgi:L,D-peptidoglycan transpeptidase YkuD (ErfK/YbiS/YcfS/YnhG family)
MNRLKRSLSLTTKRKSSRKTTTVRRKAVSRKKSAAQKSVSGASSKVGQKGRVKYKRAGGSASIHEVSVGSAKDVRRKLGIKRETIKAVEDAFAN